MQISPVWGVRVEFLKFQKSNESIKQRFTAALLPLLFGNNIQGHTTRAAQVGFELGTNCFQFYAIANLDKTSLHMWDKMMHSWGSPQITSIFFQSRGFSSQFFSSLGGFQVIKVWAINFQKVLQWTNIDKDWTKGNLDGLCCSLEWVQSASN